METDIYIAVISLAALGVAGVAYVLLTAWQRRRWLARSICPPSRTLMADDSVDYAVPIGEALQREVIERHNAEAAAKMGLCPHGGGYKPLRRRQMLGSVK